MSGFLSSTRTALIPFLAAVALSAFAPWPVSADSNGQVAQVLSTQDAYVTRSLGVSSADKKRLEGAIAAAGRRNVTAKIAITTGYPHTYQSAQQAADALRNFVSLSGVLVLVTPKEMAVSSDLLSASDERAIVRSVRERCAAGYASCAIAAVNQSIPRVQATESAANRNAALFWAVTILLLGALIAGLVWYARRRQTALIASWRETGGPPAPPVVGPGSDTSGETSSEGTA